MLINVRAKLLRLDAVPDSALQTTRTFCFAGLLGALAKGLKVNDVLSRLLAIVRIGDKLERKFLFLSFGYF